MNTDGNKNLMNLVIDKLDKDGLNSYLRNRYLYKKERIKCAQTNLTL